jgi:cytochrome c1
MMKINKIRAALGCVVVGGVMALAATAHAEEGAAPIVRQKWSFAGFSGTFDTAQLQRGYQVYSEVCAACHSLKRLSFRNLAEKGGPEFPEADVRALAAAAQVEDGPNDEGAMFNRPGRLSDRLPSPYKNEQAARYAQNGALPPDLSLIARARNVEYTGPIWYHPAAMLMDIVRGYQEGGADYIFALLTHYGDPPSYVRNPNGKLIALASGDKSPNAEQCVTVEQVPGKPDVCNKLAEGMNYNSAFPGYQLAMRPPIMDGRVTYTDGTPNTVANYTADVIAFLSWAADPTLAERKRLGWQVLLYLVITTALLFVAKRRIWSNIPH